MPAVQVRDFSQETYDLIKQEAKASGRSIMQQTKHIVLEHFEQKSRQDMAAAPASSFDAHTGESAEVAAQGKAGNPFAIAASSDVQQRAERRKALFDRIASRNYPPALRQMDSVQIVREIRDGR